MEQQAATANDRISQLLAQDELLTAEEGMFQQVLRLPGRAVVLIAAWELCTTAYERILRASRYSIGTLKKYARYC